MAQRTEYDESQATRRLRVPAAAFRWARHIGMIPAPDVPPRRWSRPAVGAIDAEAVRAALPHAPISGSTAADRIAEALGTPNPVTSGERLHVTSFVVRRFVDRGLLVDLSANPDGSAFNPDQVDTVCERADLAELVAADSPLGPDQAAERLEVRRVDFNHMLRLRWIEPSERVEARFGTSRAGAVEVPLFRTEEIDALPDAQAEVDWGRLRALGKGQRSPLAVLRYEAEGAPV